jgi:hypothetical protein
VFVAIGPSGDLFVSAAVSDPVEGLNIWIGRFDVSGIFGDDLESGDLSAWSGTVLKPKGL